MASWKDVEQEIKTCAQENQGQNPFDLVRQAKIVKLKSITGRPVLIYATDWLGSKMLGSGLQLNVSIGFSDKDYFADIATDIECNEVDLLIHSPGGIAEATESIVNYLRTKFKYIRVFIPGTAKSAATMLAMAADVLVMDELSELGPIDPQMAVNGRYAPSGAILKQFQKAEQELKDDPGKIAAWLPILQSFGPSILVECENHLNLSRRLVSKWLNQYMFASHPNAQDQAEKVAEWLSNDENFLSHSRCIGIEQLKEKGVGVLDLRNDPALQEAVRELHLALMMTFNGTGAFKLFENSEGKLIAHSVLVQSVQPG